MKKTRDYLNSKIWYRTLKVLFILTFLAVVLFYNAVLIGEEGIYNVDANRTKITCSLKKEQRVFSPKEIDVYLNDSDFKNRRFDYQDFYEGYNEYAIKDIIESCYEPKNIDDMDIFALQRAYEIRGTDQDNQDYDESYLNSQINEITSGYKTDSQKARYLDYSIKMFDIDPVFTYTEFLKNFILGNLLILLIFEILRRIFYYIALGTVRPEK